ncbi:enterotoxin A family protein [Luteibacter sp. 329MFSha]|uniref:enterotoxin A family protein n=1 Tax=Luteibacter sp. 329MFSha TaxID=1798239 RepID=UPI0008D0302B|nr:enterotoxin A family protein [Luteibacter sp. 329MFSha]SEW14819.1 Pertussis toxin, subunit 1 [Luteibacter sp. 329MFSha]
MLRFIVLLGLVATSFACHAQRFLYRMDMRPPDVIFATGFVPPGANTNLYRHVTGQTCYFSEHSGAFVATTSDPQFALDWGSELVRSGRSFYIYRIRQTAHFYNTTTSLMHAYAVTGTEAYRSTAATFVEQSEWASRGTIPPSTIIDATHYIARGSMEAPERIGTTSNLRYVAAPATVVNTPYRWDYREDAPAAPDSPGAMCGSSCFSFSLFSGRTKRHAPVEIIHNVIACRKKVANRTSALVNLFDETPIIEEKIKDEM